ncbi:MAG: glycosyltransferase family 4 protein, partial [Flavisolibacter sp.]
MRIGIEAQRIFRPKKHGMDVVAIELIKNLQEIDSSNEYTIFGRSGINDVLPAVTNYHIDTFSALTYADWEQIALPRKLSGRKLDLLHCTANTAPLNLSVPLVVTIHDIIYLEQVNFKGSTYQNLGNLYRRFIVPRVAKKAKLILTVSEFEKDNIIKTLRLPPDKVRVLYNGVAAQFNNRYTPDTITEFKKKYNLPSQFIMFLGNTAPKKNTLNVIKAYADYCIREKDPIPMVLLDFKKELVLKTLNELGQAVLLSRFVFPGYVPYAQIPLMYNLATLFLYPSLRESFGLPILEAMACGVPVITSNTSSMPEVAGDAAEIIDPFNHNELSQGISKLLLNEELRNQYKQRGLERAAMFT